MLASGLPCAYIYNNNNNNNNSNNNNNNNNNNRGQVTIKCVVTIIQCELFKFFIY
jgi:hypothetical protein